MEASRGIEDMTPRGAFIIGHVLYAITFGLVAFALLRPTMAAPTLRRAAAYAPRAPRS